MLMIIQTLSIRRANFFEYTRAKHEYWPENRRYRTMQIYTRCLTLESPVPNSVRKMPV